MKPTERARLIRDARASLSPAEVARKFNCTLPTVYNALRLLKLHPEIQAAVDAGDMPMREAVKLSRKSHAEQLDVFRRMVAADATHGARATRSMDAAKKGRASEIGRSTRALRSHEFLERWYCVLKSRPDRALDARQVLAFVLGEPPPDNRVFLKTLEEAGYRPRRYERVK